MVTTEPFARNLIGRTVVAERSQRVINCSADSLSSPQMAESMVESPSRLEPKTSMAARLALRMVPPPSTKKAGQTAFCRWNTGSGFARVVVTSPQSIPRTPFLKEKLRQRRTTVLKYFRRWPKSRQAGRAGEIAEYALQTRLQSQRDCVLKPRVAS